jgi:type I restriction enzyme S subunit
MSDVFIKPEYLEQLCSVIKSLYPKAVVLAYGSRVNGDEKTAHSGSDFDLAVKDFGQNDGKIWELKEAFQQSNLPFLVDIFDLNSLPDSFQAEIKKNNIIIYDGSK